MWKRLSRISSRQYAVGSRHYFPFLLLTAYCLLLLSSCAPKHVEMPSYKDVALNDILPALQDIKAIKATMSIIYEKQDSSMRGDAVLNVSDDSLDFRIYHLGFLAGEIQENRGIIKSNPSLDMNKSTVLVDGLKNSFFWWNIQDYSIYESEDIYVLRNSYRKIIISKDTLLPVQQTIELYNGEKLNIFYDLPQKAGEVWYQSHLKIEFRDHIVMIRVQSYSALR
jgi:hypothetical protein